MSADRADLRERISSYHDLAELAKLRGMVELARHADTLAAKYTAELLTDERTDNEIAKHDGMVANLHERIASYRDLENETQQ